MTPAQKRNENHLNLAAYVVAAKDAYNDALMKAKEAGLHVSYSPEKITFFRVDGRGFVKTVIKYNRTKGSDQ